MEAGIIGTSIWQQNLPLIERMTIDKGIRAKELGRLKERLGLSELLYLATCNRVEFVYVRGENSDRGNLLHRLLDFFFQDGRQIAFFPNDFYHYTGRDAIRHLFRTVCSLESLVVGETQVAGQFMDAAEEARRIGLSGSRLGYLAHQARQVARRVRRETEIGQGAVSMASLAASTLCSELSVHHPRIVLVGAGPMTVKCASHLKEHQSCELVFVNRTVAKAETLSNKFGGTALGLEDFCKSPGQVDGIISATAAADTVFDSEFLTRLSEASTHTVCIDLALPRDFCDAFEAADTISLVDIDVLRTREQQNVRSRFVNVSRAGEIVEKEVDNFVADRIKFSLKPIFHQSYQESMAMAEEALDDLFSKRVTSLDEDGRRAVQRLVSKLLGYSCYQPARLLSDHLANQREDLLIDDVIVKSQQSA